MSDAKVSKKTGPTMVRKMGSPIFRVDVGGVTVDWTDKYTDALGTYKGAGTYPKEMWKLESGAMTLIGRIPVV